MAKKFGRNCIDEILDGGRHAVPYRKYVRVDDVVYVSQSAGDHSDNHPQIISDLGGDYEILKAGEYDLGMICVTKRRGLKALLELFPYKKAVTEKEKEKLIRTKNIVEANLGNPDDLEIKI